MVTGCHKARHTSQTKAQCRVCGLVRVQVACPLLVAWGRLLDAIPLAHCCPPLTPLADMGWQVQSAS